MEYNAWVNQILKRREERESLLSDSDKIDAQVADVAKEYSPSSKKFSMRGAETKVEAVEKGIPDDHPMKGFTPELQDAYRKALADPELIRYKPREILSELAGRFAEPRLEPSMEYKRRADSSLSNLFGLFGEDKSVAFPLSKVHPELYQQWKSAKQEEEAATPREGMGYLESIGTTAGLTAGIGGLIGALGGPAGAVSGAVTGGVIGGLAEIPAYPLRQLIRGTEWYKAREASDSTWDKAKLLAADLGVDVVTGAGVYKGIGKAGLGLAKAAERAAGSSASLGRAMADFARVHDAGTAVELWKAARQNAKGQQQVADIMESMTSGPKFKQMVYDVTAEYQDRYRQLQELADPYFFKARRAVTSGLPAEPRVGIPEMEVVGGSARSGGKILEKRGLGEEVKGPISGLDLPGRDPREVIKHLDDESMDAVMKSDEPIGRAVLKAFDEQEALRKAKELEGERTRIAEAYRAGRDKEAQRIEAALAARTVAGGAKSDVMNSRVSQALWQHSGIEQYSGDPLGASKIAKEGKAAAERLGLKPGELGSKEAIQAEVDLNKWYDDLDVVMPERNMNPIGTAMKEAPEFIETAPGVFEKQKVVDEKTVSGLKADIEARKKAKDFIAPALGMIATAGLVAAGTVFGQGTAEASMGSTISTAAARLAQGAMKAGKSVESIAKGAVDAGLTARPLPTGALEVGDWKPMEQLRLWKKEIYEGMTSTVQAIKQVPTLSKTILSRLSPRYFDELAYQQMMMPSTQLASASSAIQHNVPEYLQLVKNIMDQHPLANTYKRAIREVNEVMKPFAERYYGDKVAFDVIENDLKEIGKQLKEKAGARSPAARNAVSALEARRVALEKAKMELLPSLQAMSAEHAALVEPLARKYATVRVALAAEDTMEFSKYPFLKGMMTRDDTVAAARIKNLMEHYAGRIKGAGEKVIESEPYIHHASHPVSSTVFAQRRLDQLGVGGGLTSPLAKFFSRSGNSLQLFPEINYIMQRYIPDAEKRIQYATFWQKGKKWGWDSHQWNDFVQSTPVLRDYWARIRESLQPPPETFWNKLANRYSTLEVVRLIGFAPSVALKHAFKVSGSMAMAGPSATIRNLPKATVLWAKNMVRQNADRAMIRSLGIDLKQPGALEELAYTYAHNNRMMQNILDYEINTLARGDKGFMSQFDKWTRTLADWGGSLVNAVEQWDRTFNVLIATEMAAKKGLTTEQAIHGILGTTLRNNFLGGPLNPRWLASPVLRSVFIFQGTPFKLWERRFMNAYHTGKAIKAAWGESYKGEGIRGVLNEMAGLKRYIQDGERELKQNLIYDAFNSKRDILGGSMPAQLMKEMLLLGTVMTVGGYLSMDFTPQVLHLPFVKTDRQEPGVTTNPFINAFFKTAAQRREAHKYDEEPDFYVSSFARNWLGKSGVIPATLHKMMRISDNDIPEIYKDSAMKYFFAVPAKK